MRPIDADAMLEYLNLMYDKQNDSDEPFNCAVLGAINYIKHKAPTVDAVSVVRCKDCKHWWTSGCINMFGQCALDGYVKNQSDFCSKGEHEETDHE